ncbi:hypothetical protein HAPAU_36260 [Halalkalicoccus paucihalophilus]|uniref:Uncharacterized protein n=1 Tax=Halalkalicoccus paucihalophilus TaxID=1008153 RepID=A0A151AAK7_9EURY|nr:hypothetical protein HAPAU_36260 [Halalkalicoccus paucihalophilus]
MSPVTLTQKEATATESTTLTQMPAMLKSGNSKLVSLP